MYPTSQFAQQVAARVQYLAARAGTPIQVGDAALTLSQLEEFAKLLGVDPVCLLPRFTAA